MTSTKIPGSSSRVAPRRAFDVLLKDCLKVQPEEDVLFLYDESVAMWIDALTEAAIQLRLRPLFAHLPKRYQMSLMASKEPGSDDSAVPLPRALRDAFANTRAVVNLLDGDLATSSLRGAVLNIPRIRGCRLAHIPGLTSEILDVLTESPIEQIEVMAEQLAWALGEAWDGELVTYRRDPSGTTLSSHRLRFQLEGWHGDPLISPGVIYPDSWGNIPPGETFICPEAIESVEGEVVVDGSIPGAALDPGEEVVLSFESGQMVAIHGRESSRAHAFLQQEQERAEARGDDAWNLFAELGVGLNPAIERLTGNSLFDEKAAGTIHIAIGDNSIFDGPIVSETHADMICRGPDLLLDGRTIVCRGAVDVDAIQSWRRQVEMKPVVLKAQDRFVLDDARMEERDGRLALRLCRNGRVGFVHLGEEATGRRLAELTRCLPHHKELSKQALRIRARGWPIEEVEHLLGILRHYQIAHIKSKH